ncbi:hypothetical protein [Streptosporangium sp. LJ11]|uniref:hypothetical protein n=1 Tax=Streptosporangium sp. LJ11 TaxID=3436927 RepID=UPI003F7B0EA1
MQEQDGWWAALSPQVRGRIDEQLRRQRLIEAIVLLRSEGGFDLAPDLYEMQNMLRERSVWLAEQGLVDLEEPPVQVPQLIGMVNAISEPVVAVEVLWDGDTQGWFVELVAIVQRPGRYHHRFDERPLALFRRGSDLRLFNGEVPPWPEAVEAAEKGQAVARSLGVPFHFASPDTPDDESPRWWDSQAA